MNTRIFCNGMTALKKFMIPTACSAAAAVITTSTDKKETSEPPKIRPSELPIYSKDPVPLPKCEPQTSADSVLYSSVRQVRKCIWTLLDEGKVLGQQACDYIETGKAHTASSLAFLREEENRIPRYGAIGIGGLAGFVLALRRGKFKKLLYTTTGATAMAALCYPKEAEQYTSEGLKLAKQYIVIGYHFVNGVLRDYAGVQLPSLPKPLSGSNSASESEAAVPSSSSNTLLPIASVAATPSHSQLGPIPMPPIDIPSNVTDADSKSTHTKREVQPRKINNEMPVNTGQVGENLISSTHSLASPLCRCVETHQACYHNQPPKVSSELPVPPAAEPGPEQSR